MTVWGIFWRGTGKPKRESPYTQKSQETDEEQAMVEEIRETCLQLFLNCIPKKQRIAFTLIKPLKIRIAKGCRVKNFPERKLKPFRPLSPATVACISSMAHKS